MSQPAIPQFALNREVWADLDMDFGSGTLHTPQDAHGDRLSRVMATTNADKCP
jgi:hypothetical protein